MRYLELLAPARTAEIGKAAIDCGADAVYIAGPAFGARQAAGNTVEEIDGLCAYAHRFGARIYATVNTILYENELPEAQKLVSALEEAGVDALIVQDPAVLQMSGKLVMHASTQCAIRTPEKARFLESLGYGRLVLERELSLEQVRAISRAVEAEIEFFVHGALCVCYSGQCYLSEYLTGRSANRGECAQPCRSLYDLEDADGKLLERNKALLSLKDYNLLHRLEELAGAGVTSFKIEGRLKSESYVRNVVKAYSEALDALVDRCPDQYRRASFGHVSTAFRPDLDKTFNRGYTELFLDGRRGRWASMDAPKSMGEFVGTVARMLPDGLLLQAARPDLTLANGDGFAFVAPDGSIVGFRADVCDGLRIRCRKPAGLREGLRLYRNISAAFERQLEAGKPVRELEVALTVTVAPDGRLNVQARSEDGREACAAAGAEPGRDCTAFEPAREPEKMLQTLRSQLGKRSGHYRFLEPAITVNGPVPFLGTAAINGIRRELAARLDGEPCRMHPLRQGHADTSVPAPAELSYKDNIANTRSRALYASRGAVRMQPAYELAHPAGAELMRTRYCVRYELGLCPRLRPGLKTTPLVLENAGRRLRLRFHCATCEMTVEALDHGDK